MGLSRKEIDTDAAGAIPRRDGFVNSGFGVLANHHAAMATIIVHVTNTDKSKVHFVSRIRIKIDSGTYQETVISLDPKVNAGTKLLVKTGNRFGRKFSARVNTRGLSCKKLVSAAISSLTPLRAQFPSGMVCSAFKSVYHRRRSTLSL